MNVAPARAYTIKDTPSIQKRIDADLAHIVQAVRDADPSLRALILTGGFARGEGAVLNGEPQNDYDLVAVRGSGKPRIPYEEVRIRLARRLGLHIDLATVAAWRLRWVAPSIFWYETALRGRVLWGEDLLGRLPVRSAHGIDAREGLRLLVNRAAGLLLVAGSKDHNALRLQAAKALLASADARLLATGRFAPSQHERWAVVRAMRDSGIAPRGLEPRGGWFTWAYEYKVDPGAAERRDGHEAWLAARKAVLQSIPIALEHAGLDSMEEYGRQGGLIDAYVYARRCASVPTARRWARHPTGKVRVATIRLLESASDGFVAPEDAKRCFADIARLVADPLPTLEGLRAATLQ